MSAKNFTTSLGLTLVYEGGWSDNPKDPGGATMRGVTQAVYDDYRRGLGKPLQSVRLISNAEVTAVYKWRYWSRIAGDALPLGIDYAVFDYAVNSGVSRAARDLQELVGAKPDGLIGQSTLNAVAGYVAAHGAVALTDAVCDQRIKFLMGLSTFATFGSGWKRRVMGAEAGRQAGDTGVIDRAADMALGHDVEPPTAPRVTKKTYLASSGYST